MKKIISFFLLLFFNIILNNNETKNLNDNQSSSLNDQYSSSSSEDVYNLNTFITLLIVLISLILLVVILFIFYKFYLNSYIERNKIPNFKTTNKFELKKHFLFQKLMKWKFYKNNGDEEVCPICLQKFNKSISKICITPCKHIFHFYCLKKFVFEFNNLNCPYCKKEYLSSKNFDLHGIRIIPLDEKDNPINELKNFYKMEKPLDSEGELNNNQGEKNIQENINNNVNNNSNHIENN